MVGHRAAEMRKAIEFHSELQQITATITAQMTGTIGTSRCGSKVGFSTE
jgi:hypothetical protein